VKTLINLIGLGGFSALSYGARLTFGLGPALMLCGCLALVFALVAMSKIKRGP
jgi:hypothetical protein